jgi:hypothetical protein
MTPREVRQATEDGRMDALLAGCDIRQGKRLTLAQWGKVVANLSPEELLEAEKARLLEPLANWQASRRLPTTPTRAHAARGTRPCESVCGTWPPARSAWLSSAAISMRCFVAMFTSREE